ncbi:MAG TPA: nucleotidyl transferase, partial [Erysipelotrichaceae bacterium]|nr:nucleotidyl transferase [Erysipelotrichaceae bacterium]
HYSVLEGNNIIGDRTTIFNMAKVANGSVIGKDCRLDQTFEFLGGTMMDHVYAVHLGEFFGCLGENSDLGAGTICGTLRFDDGQSVHRIKGKKEVPIAYANATYLGDQCRTGVGAYLMPGVKIGARSVVGSGVVLSEDLEDDAIIFVKQETVIKKWRSDQYGW